MARFDNRFSSLTKNMPFPWQQSLFERFVSGDFPSSCNLPTGLGKTAIIPIWLLALAERPDIVPRRLVYVVNRRTVVDQATREAESVREQLKLDSASELLDQLRQLCALECKLPLAISTLRGQFADNAEWRLDPSRPAIIVGTVDMIGSRLLFSGYGCGFKSRPLHAGFLGQDALLVHDEAHLEPAFQDLLLAIEREQDRCGDFKKLRVMELSATSRGKGPPFELTQQEKEGKVPIVAKRLHAKKTIRLHRLDDERKIADRVTELALGYRDSGAAVLVFVRRVEDVEKIAKKLPEDRTRQLTGTMRGLERDGLVNNEVFARFLPKGNRPGDVQPKEGTVWLVCTSAGEVGINISADHLISDLTPFDSMAQRFGRVNRFGDGDAMLDIVHPSEFDDETEKHGFEARRRRTLDLLNRLNGDGSPAALSKLPVPDRQGAFTPLPEILPTSQILFDAWSLTTIKDQLPGRPPVADYLHGVPTDWQPPETHVAWRSEVERISGDLLDSLDPEELLADYPLKPHELLRDRYDRVFKHLERLAERYPASPVWLIGGEEVEPLTLRELVRRGKDAIANMTVLLPPTVGGLSAQGTLGDAEGHVGLDVADEWKGNNDAPRRRRFIVDAGEELVFDEKKSMRLVRRIVLDTESSDERDQTDEAASKEWHWFVVPQSADDEGSRTALREQPLDRHNNAVGAAITNFIRALRIEGAIGGAFLPAGQFHDSGKNRPLWQRSIGNPNLDRPLAKSDNRKPPEIRTGYRHEFGSLLDVENDAAFIALGESERDLVRHLIAAHHGRARPDFPKGQDFVPDTPEDVTTAASWEVSRRYARLQRKYGRWGLAYLESLLRAADAYASANPTESGR